MFEVPAGDGRFTVRVCDGAEFIARDGPAYDTIMVDGYDGESQVETLSSREFYAACRRRLDAGGVLVVNLWGSDRAFDDYVARIESAFPAGTLCLPAERPGNVILFAFRDAPGNPFWDDLDARARGLEARYGLEFGKFVRGLRKMNRCDEQRLYL
jgi:spermidine synthase